MTVHNVMCIGWGGAFAPEYVNRLHAAVLRNLTGQVRFACLTDDPQGIASGVEIIRIVPDDFTRRLEAARLASERRGPMLKTLMRKPGIIPDLQGPVLSLDLDVIITGSLDPLMSYAPGKVCMRRVWTTPSRRVGLGNSSVVRFDPALHGYLYDRLAANTEDETIRHHGSEQAYLSYAADEAGDFEPFPDDWIASFKYDCRPRRPLNLVLPPRLPPEARVVCFHGRPKMAEAIDGYRAGPLHSTLPADWIRNNWRDA